MNKFNRQFSVFYDEYSRYETEVLERHLKRLTNMKEELMEKIWEIYPRQLALKKLLKERGIDDGLP
jgi:hypothetical protein